MDNLFGEIDCRSKSDGIVMEILRCAMDKAHEKVQSEAGSIEFLHERSKFYELAVILVESGLSIIQEETDILESNREKVMLDLTEMRHWLLGRIKVMKLLINEKDRELTERTENELKLRQVLESKEREVLFLRDKLENQRTMSEGSLDLDLLLKKKAKLEGETSDSKSDSELLNEESFQQDNIYGSYNNIPKIKPIIDSLRPEQNNVIQQMSSDIDILNETLDFAFGRRDNGEMVPVEKQWRCTIEKDTLSILIKGFIQNIKQRFDDTLKETLDVTLRENVEIVIFEKQLRCTIEEDILCVLIRGSISNFQQRFEVGLKNFLGDQIPLEFSNNNLAEFISEVTMLRKELEVFCNRYDDGNKVNNNQDLLPPLAKIRRTCSEPLPEFDQEDDQKVSGNNYVAKLIKNHEFVIRKQSEDQHYIKKEVFRDERSTLHKKEKELDFLNIMIKNFITRLDDISSLSLKAFDKNYVKCKENINMENISRTTMEDKVITSDCTCEVIKDSVGVLKEEVDNLNLQVLILEEIYLIIYEGFFMDHNVACFNPFERTTTLLLSQFDTEYENSEAFIKDFSDGSILPETIGSLLKEVVYKEMLKAWKDEIDDFYMEVQIREDLYKFMIVESTKDVHTKMLKYLNLTYKKVDFDETEGNLTVKTSLEIEEHSEEEILECEGVNECETIKSLLNDDVSTFNSVNEKLEIAMKQLSTCKELLVDLEQNLDISPDVLDTRTDDCVYVTNTSLVVETEKLSHESITQVDDNKMTLFNVLFSAQLSNFHQMIQEFEINVVKNLDMKSLRIEELKHQFQNFIVEPVALMKNRKLLYKKAFLARCQNLKLAETEVDLLGNQVEELLHLLKNIYIILDQNSTILSFHFQVFDILKLIKDELADGVAGPDFDDTHTCG